MAAKHVALRNKAERFGRIGRELQFWGEATQGEENVSMLLDDHSPSANRSFNSGFLFVTQDGIVGL
jgi:hypothetical protein